MTRLAELTARTEPLQVVQRSGSGGRSARVATVSCRPRPQAMHARSTTTTLAITTARRRPRRARRRDRGWSGHSAGRRHALAAATPPGRSTRTNSTRSVGRSAALLFFECISLSPEGRVRTDDRGGKNTPVVERQVVRTVRPPLGRPVQPRRPTCRPASGHVLSAPPLWIGPSGRGNC
jgi:hypothetical protein